MKFYTQADYKDAIKNINKVIRERQKLGLPLRVPMDALIFAERAIIDTKHKNP